MGKRAQANHAADMRALSLVSRELDNAVAALRKMRDAAVAREANRIGESEFWDAVRNADQILRKESEV